MLAHWPEWLRDILFRLLGIHWSERFLERAWREGDGDFHGMLDWIFRHNRFRMEVLGGERLQGIDGCLIAGNHPHGLFDGLALAWLASRDGYPTRILARHFLQVFAPLQDVFLSVRLDGRRRAQTGSRAGWLAAGDWLAQGQRLVITPAGGMSRAYPPWARAVDPPWRSGVVRLARQSGKPLVLVHVGMPDSMLRQMLHRIHPVLRALCQVWAYRLGKSTRITLTVCDVVYPDELPDDLDATACALWLQRRMESAITQGWPPGGARAVTTRQ